jgi:P-type conjugative transfer protein TrbJ
LKTNYARLVALLLGSPFLLAAMVTPAGAQFGMDIVYDPSAYGQLITQVSYQVQQLDELIQQVQQGQTMLQSLGTDITPGLANLIQQSQSLLQSLNGISATGASLTSLLNSEYPTDFSSVTDPSQLISQMAQMQTQVRSAMENSASLQSQVAQNQPQIAAAVQSGVTASNSAVGPTAALQATNQLLAALSTQLADLQNLLISHFRAEDENNMNTQSQISAAQQQFIDAVTAPYDPTITPATNY